MTEQQVWDFIRAWKRQDIDALMGYVSDECVYITTTGPAPGTVYRGRDEVRQGFMAVIAEGVAAKAEEQYGPLFLFDGYGLLEWRITTVNEKNERVTMRGCDVLEFDGDKIRRKDAFRKVFG